MRRPRGLAVETDAERDRGASSGREHEVRVARVEAERDAAAGLPEHDALGTARPLAVERPLVEAEALGRACGAPFAATAAEVRLRRPQVVPVGRGLHAGSLDGDRRALDAEQPLNHALRLLVASLAEMLVADDAVGVDEVERRPVVVGERAPDRVVVVGRNRVVDLALLHRLPHEVDVVLERELRRVDSDHDQAVVAVRLRPRADVRLLAKPVDAGERPEVHEHHAAAQAGGVERLGADPSGRPAERRQVQGGQWCAISSSATASARISGSSSPLTMSMPYVSRTRNHFLEMLATTSPSRLISYSWSTTFPRAFMSSPFSTSMSKRSRIPTSALWIVASVSPSRSTRMVSRTVSFFSWILARSFPWRSSRTNVSRTLSALPSTL